MSKDSIYRIIGYNGEYNANVKKAIRKLLKDNHPDNNGDRKTFELINEVKKELEENKVSFNYKNNKSSIKMNKDIDNSYCLKMVETITKKKNIYTKELEEKEKELANYISKYKDFYRDSIDLETYLLSNSQYMDKLKKTRGLCVILLILSIISFCVSVLKKSIILFIIFVALAMICVFTIQRAFYLMQKITENNRNKVKKYVGINSKIRDNQSDQEELKKEINELNRKINALDNDLRFYNNILK